MFDEKGQIFVAKEDCSMDADELMMLALDAGAEDFNDTDGSGIFQRCAPETGRGRDHNGVCGSNDDPADLC